MCVTWFCHLCHPDPAVKLLLAFNRDEYYSRPTSPFHFWPDKPHILAGRDDARGGTWLGISRQGRLALLTNFRWEGAATPSAQSRGALTTDFLDSTLSPRDYLLKLCHGMQVNAYASFNLIVADILQGEMWYYCHTHPDISSPPHPKNPTASGPIQVLPGVHGLSNSVLDSPWPKVSKGCAALQQIMAECPPGQATLSRLLALQQDKSLISACEQLPVTGMPPHVERDLSAIFTDCTMPEGPFGTRSCVALQVRVKGGHNPISGEQGRANVTLAGGSPARDGADASSMANGVGDPLWEVLLLERYKADDGIWKQVDFTYCISTHHANNRD
eukprot:jgi/Mesvir1/8551/Mv18354-RA.1